MNGHLRNGSIQQHHELASAQRGGVWPLRADPIRQPRFELLLVGGDKRRDHLDAAGYAWAAALARELGLNELADSLRAWLAVGISDGFGLDALVSGLCLLVEVLQPGDF
jgi:hypothetical protein